MGFNNTKSQHIQASTNQKVGGSNPSRREAYNKGFSYLLESLFFILCQVLFFIVFKFQGYDIFYFLGFYNLFNKARILTA